MSRLVKIVDNNYVQIEEYKNPNICFNTNEYDNFEDYCTLRKTFDPFKMFYENQKLKDNWIKLKEIAKSQSGFKKRAGLKGGVWFEIDELLDKMQELEQGTDSNE